MKTLPSEHNSAAMHSFFGVNAAGVRIRVPAGLRLITDEMPGSGRTCSQSTLRYRGTIQKKPLHGGQGHVAMCLRLF